MRRLCHGGVEVAVVRRQCGGLVAVRRCGSSRLISLAISALTRNAKGEEAKGVHTANIFKVIFTVFNCVRLSTVVSLYGLHLIAAPSTIK